MIHGVDGDAGNSSLITLLNGVNRATFQPDVREKRSVYGDPKLLSINKQQLSRMEVKRYGVALAWAAGTWDL